MRTGGYRTQATRVTCGATSFMNSGSFPKVDLCLSAKPVILPPRRARLSTKPAPTGSVVRANRQGPRGLLQFAYDKAVVAKQQVGIAIGPFRYAVVELVIARNCAR
jgi:hypothetical protein